MALTESDLKIFKSSHSAANISSLGGASTNVAVSEDVNSLWDNITDSELSSSVVGEYEVRCVYITNKTPCLDTMKVTQVWIEQNTASPFTDIDIGIGTAAVGDIEQTVPNENTLPSNVFWTFARGEENAQLLGDLPKDQGKSLWIRRHAGPAKSGSSYPSDNYILRFKFLKASGGDCGGAGGGGGPGPGPEPPPAQNDPFGVRMIYKSKESGTFSPPFYMNMNDPYSSCRFATDSGNTATKNADGSWALATSSKPKIRLFSDQPGCARDIWNTTLDTYDHDIWGDRGYMYKPNDWKNVEITGYFKVVAVDTVKTTGRVLSLYSRTLRNDRNVGGGCSGTAYKGVIDGFTQELKWEKKSFHYSAQPCGDSNTVTFKEGIGRTDNNQWFGMKFIMWNYPKPGGSAGAENVHLELWTDFDATNTWIKQGERDDTPGGGWYPGAPDPNCPGDEYCGGSQDQVIKWGGPISEIQWDSGYTNVHFKSLSCREIIPGEVSTPPPVEPPPSTNKDIFGINFIYATKSGGDLWQSTAWGNGQSRAIIGSGSGDCTEDPYDSRLSLTSSTTNRADINGAQIMKISKTDSQTGSPRIPVSGTWQNVESSVYIRASDQASSGDGVNVDLRMKTDHFCTDDDTRFGGYIINLDWKDQTVSIGREESHAIGYAGPDSDSTSVSLARNQWLGFKAICYNTSTGNVKLECYMDTTEGSNGGSWFKVFEATDDGTWTGSGGGTPIFTTVHSQSAIRTNVGVVGAFAEYKWWSIREIVPPT